MGTHVTQTAPAGWYPNPENPTQQRYWDGAAWTDNVAPMAPPQPVVQPPRAPAPAPTSTQVGSKGAVESVVDYVEGRRKRLDDEKRQKEEAAAEAAKAAEVAAKAEAERRSVQNQKIAYFAGKHWKALLAGFVALVLIITVGLWIQPKEQVDPNTAAMPESAAALKGENYQDVKTKLKTAGFTSVETSAIPDLVTGWLKKDGEVEEVSVNGGTDYSDGSRFPKSATIVIRYHTFPERESAKAAESTPTAGGTPESSPPEVDNAVLTPQNSEELKAVLKAENPGDPEVQAFITKNTGRTIEFDGYTGDWMNHTTTSSITGKVKKYDSVFDTNIYAGNVKSAGKSSKGPIFRVEGFSILYGPAVSRANVHVKATVSGYDQDREFFELTSVKLELR